MTLPNMLGFLLVGLFLLRNSVLAALVPASNSPVFIAMYAVLGGSFIYILLSQTGIVIPGVLWLAACLPGSCLSEQSSQSLIKYDGMALLILVVGPVLRGPKARRLRVGAWNTIQGMLVAVGVASFFWWALRLPKLGYGDIFSGVMYHPNTLAPMAALGAVIALARGMFRQGKALAIWALAGGCCVLPMVIAGSRTSLIAFLASLLVVFAVQWQKAQRFLIYAIPVVLLLAVGGYKMVLKSKTGAEITGTIQEKGFDNSREALWAARLAEYHAHSYIGMGVGMGEGAGFEQDAAGNVQAEPGSSYLAVLSMTGLSGAMGLGILLLWFMRAWFSGFRHLSLEQAGVLSGVGAFMVCHAIGEGWLLAVGSPLCLIFWLWMGYSADCLSGGPRAAGNENRAARRGRRARSKEQEAESTERRVESTEQVSV